jgi:hypothetical protein
MLLRDYLSRPSEYAVLIAHGSRTIIGKNQIKQAAVLTFEQLTTNPTYPNEQSAN